MLRKLIKAAVRHATRNRYRPLTHIVIDHKQMLANIAYIQAQHPGFEIVPVLKGNAYGHGLEQVAAILQQAGQCRYVAVDGYFEAAKIVDICRQQVLVMGYILPHNVAMLDIGRCSFVVQDIAVLHAFGALNKLVRIHIECNTGMNRLGLSPNELDAYLRVVKSYPKLQVEGVMTHLADADNKDDRTMTDAQTVVFDNMVERILAAGINPELIHIAQTAGSVKAKSRFANGIRLGIGVYGINPLQPADRHYNSLVALRPVLELRSTIIKTLELHKGDRVSYAGTFCAPGPMRIGILPLGYYEGIPRELSNRGCVTSGKQVLPIVGRVCMDHIAIDLSDNRLQLYDEVTVISANPDMPNSINHMQLQQNLYAYVTLTALSSSIRREIV